MTRQIGDRATFAVEVGEMRSPTLRVVDLWAAGRRLTTDDNVAYLPAFARHLRSDAQRVHRRDVKPCPFPGRTPEDVFRLLQEDETEVRERFWFLRWGETVDNVSAYAYLDKNLVIVFQFWRSTHPVPDDLGKVFVAGLPPDEFVATVEQAADLLDDDPGRGTA